MAFAMITDQYSVSGELSEQDFEALNELDITLLINARPDNETENQKTDAEFRVLCAQHGIDYVHVPVNPGQYSELDIKAVSEALSKAKGKVHGVCRTGTRAAHLWALTQKEHQPFDALQEKAKAQGFCLEIVKGHF